MNWKSLKDNPIPKDGNRYLVGRKDETGTWRYAVVRWMGDFWYAGKTSGITITATNVTNEASHWSEIKSPEEI